MADDERELLHGLIEELREQLRTSQRENARLRHQLEQAVRRLYGRKSERRDPNQGELDLGADPAPPTEEEGSRGPETEEEVESARARSRRGRKKLPKDLPRKRIVLEPEAKDLVCPCCEGERRRIGSDITEELEYEPAVLYINEYERPKYACPRCEEGVVQAALPARPIEKGRPGPGLLAHVVVSKYSEHLPLYRQETVFPRAGVAISRRTLCDWVRAVAELGEPIVDFMKNESVLTSKVIHSDDTRITVQDPRHPGGSRSGYLWVYGGDQDDLVYDFTPSRSRDGPLAFLGDYAGYLQADAYSGYDEVFRMGRVIEVGCWAHARRYFFEAVKTALEPATELLAQIRRLYAVERAAKDLNATARRDLRQEKSDPILQQIEETLEEIAPHHLPKSPMGEAIGYARRQWRALTRYAEDGDLEIDNNASERALRMVAVGRKNWLFAGSDAGGRRAAILYSLIGTCKRIGIDPFAYLRDLIARVSTHPMRRINELTPRGWKAERAAACTP
ncbi:MAG: IS66 family transposase [Gemmatimonadota bacterium]|nr:MAG: IS66 family transposase [Gemmatimonadota bacterium]